MSVDLMKWAIRQPLKPVQKLVLMLLADYGNEHQGKTGDKQPVCWPGQRRLADESGLSERGLRQALADLEALGLITRQRRWKAGHANSNEYLFHPEVQAAPMPAADADNEAIPAGRAGMAEGFIPAGDAGSYRQDVPEYIRKNHKVEPEGARVAAPAPATGLFEEPESAPKPVEYHADTGKFSIQPEVLDAWIERYRRVVDPEHWSPERAEEWIRHQVRSAAEYIADPKVRRKYRDLKRFLDNQLARAGERLIVPQARFARRGGVPDGARVH